MDWILKKVAVGSWQDASNHSLLESENVGAILNARSDENEAGKKEANRREKEYCSAHNIEYCYIPLKDFTTATDDQFVSGTAFIARSVKLGKKVLVHCGAGSGRSPSFVATYLLFRKECKDTASAIELIRGERRYCFEGDDAVHIARIREFEKKLPELRSQILERVRSEKCP